MYVLTKKKPGLMSFFIQKSLLLVENVEMTK